MVIKFITSVIRSLLLLLSFLGATSVVATAQLSLEGASYAQATAPEGERMQVFVVHRQLPQFTLRITAAPGSTLQSYTHKAIEAQVLHGATYQNGAWVLENPPLNCGYFIQPTQGLPTAYYWLVDYDAAPLPLGALTAQPHSDNPCEQVVLTADIPFDEFLGYTPSGSQITIPRHWLLRYSDALYQPEEHRFLPEEKKRSLRPTAGKLLLQSPLVSGTFTLLGDAFTAPLKQTYTPLESNYFETQRIEAYPHITVRNTAMDSIASGSGVPKILSAPTEIDMQLITNKPVATHLQWRIYRGNEQGEIVFQYPGDVCSYQFLEAGNFTIVATASPRSGLCSVSTKPITLSIQSSRLEVPNAFSPSSSPGINDKFRVIHTSIVSFQGHIYNEYGYELFSWSDPNDGWDGTYNGAPVTGGVYYYVIIAEGADGTKYQKTGHINVLQSNNQPTLPHL